MYVKKSSWATLTSVATLLLWKSTRFHDKKTLYSQKKHQITKANLHRVKMARKCITMPTIVQLIVNPRQRKREIAATLVFVCPGAGH